MFAPVARLTDMHLCPMQTPAVVPIPHVGGPVVGPGAMTVMAGGIPVAVQGDMAICVGPPDVLTMGSATVLAMGRPVVRVGDTTAHGGSVIVGLPTVMVGDSGGAGSSQGATMSAAKAGGSAFVRSECNAKAADAVARQAPPPPPDTGTDWVEIEVKDAEGKALPYQKVQVTDAEGTTRIAFSDANGLVRVSGMAKGACKVTLPDLDQSSWAAG
jgi:uncharacterized Zn-binding protein involved in type VI secretion